MTPAEQGRGMSRVKPHFHNLAGSGELLRGFTAEVNLEEASVENAGLYPEMASRHILLLKAGASNATKLEWTMNGGRRNRLFRPGELILNPAGLNSKPRWDASVKLLVLAIESERMRELALQSDARPGLEIVPRYGMEDPLLAGMLRAVTREFESETPDLLYAETMTIATVTHLLHKCTVHPPSARKYSDGFSLRTMRAIHDYMHAHIGHRVTLEDLAALVGISPSHFLRQFRRSTGIPPHQHLLQLRLEAAERLLRDSHLSISEIAAQTGFSDQSHLTRLFRRHRGITPHSFRQM
jgi:AraC family transcriptional regulator